MAILTYRYTKLFLFFVSLLFVVEIALYYYERSLPLHHRLQYQFSVGKNWLEKIKRITDNIYPAGVTQSVKQIYYQATPSAPNDYNWDLEHKPWRYFETVTCGAGYRCKWATKASDADAVLFFAQFHRGIPPEVHASRRPSQRWVIFSIESPGFYTIIEEESMKNKFNWTASYMRSSHIWIPYSAGYIPLTKQEQLNVPKLLYNPAEKTGFAFAVISNCAIPARMGLIKILKRHVNVDVYGRCGKEQPPRYFGKMLELSKRYRFYLAFENDYCKEYLTEKFWMNGLIGNAVPVAYGGFSREDYDSVAPPHSFVYVEDFKNVFSLATYLKKLATNEAEYSKFFEWKRKFKVHHTSKRANLNLMCNLCQRLHTDSTPSIVDVESHWNYTVKCKRKKVMEEY